MMMMLTTQLTYTPTASALATSGKPPVETPKSTAIGLVETRLQADSFDNTATDPIGTAQNRSGKASTLGLLAIVISTVLATLLLSNEGWRTKIFDLFKRIAGNSSEDSSDKTNNPKPTVQMIDNSHHRRGQLVTA
jgi:hypothetical protein